MSPVFRSNKLRSSIGKVSESQPEDDDLKNESKDGGRMPEFGSPEMRNLFYLGDGKADRGTIFINHGSYGTTPKSVMEKRFELLSRIESNPDRWFRRDRIQLEVESTEMLAKFVGSESVQDLVYVDCTTTGVNVILKSLKLSPDDILVATNHTYGATRKTAMEATNRGDADILTLDFPKQIENEDQIVQIFEDAAIRYKGSIQLAIVDHITSVSGIKLPVTQIANVLRPHGVLVMVDGAHGPGQIKDLEISKLGVDFYVASMHKWMFAPKGCGFLWVNPIHQQFIHPLITSHNYQMPFPDEFHTRGTRDETGFCAALEGMRFHRALGGVGAITGYVIPLLDWAVDMFCQELDVKPFVLPTSMQAPHLRVFECPKWISAKLKHNGGYSQDVVNEMVETLVTEHGLIMCLTVFNGKCWIRISGHVYNTKEDYLKAKDVLLSFKEESKP